MDKKKCEVCDKETYHRLQDKKTKKQYAFCLDCYYKGIYNKELFDFVSPRGSITDY